MSFSLKQFSLGVLDNKPRYTEETISILRLIRSENVGTKTFYDLIKVYKTAEHALKFIAGMSINGGRKKPIKVASKEDVLLEIQKCEKINAEIITYKDKNYPKLLSYISDPPPILQCIGKISLLNSEKIAIIGARNASLHGKAFANKIAKDLSKAGITIVSGLARGIDTSAHEASLPNTVAVLAGGVDNIYPPENSNLYEAISQEGLLVAEMPIGSAPLPQHFPQRNRIISGISLGVVVIEATMKSGSLITARFALEQNREVFSVPGFPGDPRSQGTNYLIKSGAHILEGIDDIMSNLNHARLKNKQLSLEFGESDSSEFMYSADFNPQDITIEMRKRVEDLLSFYPVSIELILRESKLPLQILYTIILEMELAGKISRHPLNKIALIPS